MTGLVLKPGFLLLLCPHLGVLSLYHSCQSHNPADPTLASSLCQYRVWPNQSKGQEIPNGPDFGFVHGNCGFKTYLSAFKNQIAASAAHKCIILGQ